MLIIARLTLHFRSRASSTDAFNDDDNSSLNKHTTRIEQSVKVLTSDRDTKNK